jgi:hypothetical protein
MWNAICQPWYKRIQNSGFLDMLHRLVCLTSLWEIKVETGSIAWSSLIVIGCSSNRV